MPRFEVREAGVFNPHAMYVLDTPTQGVFEITEDDVQDLYDAIDECDREGEGLFGSWWVRKLDDGYFVDGQAKGSFFADELTENDMNDLVHSIEVLGFE